MLEERCILCGLHLGDDGRVYCSHDCENEDLYSPSISSSSSLLSSPQLGSTLGGEVPALMPSALGSALKIYTARNPYSISSSSSASSASWSLFTDEEDHQYSSSSSEYSGPDAFDPNMKVQNLINPVKPSALSYTRVPSSINNQSLVPQLKHPRSRHVRGFPKSAPIRSNVPPEDLASSDADFSSNELLDSDSEANSNLEQDDRLITVTKRSRNRASLPACFSLLHIMAPSERIRSPPISSSSGSRTVRSPPTPKLLSERPGSTLLASPTVVPLSSLYDTPRGRRRVAGHSSCSNRSGSSSQSSSRRRRRLHVDGSLLRADQYAMHSPERGFSSFAQEFSSPIRGRPTIRRSSSPLLRIISDVMNAGTRSSPSDSHSRPRRRGRARVEDLDGVGSLIDAPGYGSGRSGLLDRERDPRPWRVPI